MDYWIDGLVRAEPAAPNSSRKKKKLTESGTESGTSYLAASAAGPVAQASKPAVSPTSKSAGCSPPRPPGGFGNPRYNRLGSLRYRRRVNYAG